MRKTHAQKMFRALRHVPPHYWVVAGVCLLVAGILGGIMWYGHTRFTALSARASQIETRLASTTVLLQENITEIQKLLSEELDQERENVIALQERLGNFQEQVGSISGSVSTLEKLSRTDPELLQKYSKVFFLNEHYAPERVTEIPDALKYNEQRNYAIHARVYPYLENMLKAAKADGIDIYVFSAYRSFDEQSALKGQYTTVYGAGTANQFSADQGYSEHQLGSTADLITTGIGGTLNGFENTEAYQWLLNNAHRFGFTLSYPEGNSFYVFEPWHWRFVGVKLATNLHNTNRQFYDLDQREIDEYIVSLFD